MGLDVNLSKSKLMGINYASINVFKELEDAWGYIVDKWPLLYSVLLLMEKKESRGAHS